MKDTGDRKQKSRISIPSEGIVLLGTIKGLISDGKIVSKAFRRYKPEALGIHISPEELEGLKAVIDGSVSETPMSSYEMVYARKLSRYGEVQIPSPSLIEACKLALESGIEIITLDMDDEEYSEVYTDTIGGLSMIRSSLRLRSINRKKFDLSTAEDFAMSWDRSVNGSRQYRKLERKRERFMAQRILESREEHDPILCVIEYERMEGISARILSPD